MGDSKTIYLLRHGQSVKNADKRLYYSEQTYDHLTGLTEKGRAQSLECGRRLAAKIQGPYTTFVSPYLRAQQTLERILSVMPQPPSASLIDGRLREQEWRSFPSEQELLAAREERKKQGKLYYRFENGESGYDVVARVGSFFNQLRMDWMLGNREDDVIIVCHEVVCRAFQMIALDGTPEMFEDLSVDNCAIQILRAGPKLLFGRKVARG